MHARLKAAAVAPTQAALHTHGIRNGNLSGAVWMDGGRPPGGQSAARSLGAETRKYSNIP
eukprot:scaffold19764_cov114-Isochrysis_galbana.AAC.10